MTTRAAWAFLLFGGLAPPAARAADRPDVPVADFEGDDYGTWTATGTAFGRGPARGALPGQMAVTGFRGKGLVSSFHGGDDATGTLTSPPIRVERPWINFLIGGGKYPGQTCVNLLLDGQVVRSSTGPNDRPGGTEQLRWESWDVGDLLGRSVTIEVVDLRTGGWGHVSVDEITQGDRPLREAPAERSMVLERRYLNFPVKNGAPKRRLTLRVGGEAVRDFETELADGAPDFWAFDDLSAYKGRRLTVSADALPAGSIALASLKQGDEIEGGVSYAEKDRPQFHFTSLRGWLNDPNGLVFFRGEYHLFYQHNPYGWGWGNMHWGHAVSPDLVHWKELPVAIYPRRFGDWAFSGSAVADPSDTAGFRDGAEPALVAAYTSTGRGECVVFSRDRGRTWQEYPGNPVVRHKGRDPKLLWHPASTQWVMAVYDEHEGGRWVAFYTSPDLKAWTFRSRIAGFFECPDLFALDLDGDPSRPKWVLYAADGKYVVGDFDGATFRPEPGKHQLWHGNFYAAQTFSDAPAGRRIQIGWAQGIAFPGMPFNQQMTVPCELTLRSTPEGARMFAEPVAELSSLRGRSVKESNLRLEAGLRPLTGLAGELVDAVAEIEVGTASTVGLSVRGVPVTYDAGRGELTCLGKSAPLAAVGGKVRLRVLADRGSIEVFGNDGRVALSVGAIPSDGNRPPELFATGGVAVVTALEVFELKSAWPRP